MGAGCGVRKASRRAAAMRARGLDFRAGSAI
jgi:hypothetical protein